MGLFVCDLPTYINLLHYKRSKICCCWLLFLLSNRVHYTCMFLAEVLHLKNVFDNFAILLILSNRLLKRMIYLKFCNRKAMMRRNLLHQLKCLWTHHLAGVTGAFVVYLQLSCWLLSADLFGWAIWRSLSSYAFCNRRCMPIPMTLLFVLCSCKFGVKVRSRMTYCSKHVYTSYSYHECS